VDKFYIATQIHCSENTPTELGNPPDGAEYIFVSRPAPNIRKSVFVVLHFVQATLRKESDCAVGLSKGWSAEILLGSNRRGAVNFLCGVNICKTLGQIISGKLKIYDIVHIERCCIARIFPLRDKKVADDRVRLNLIYDSADRDDQGIVQNYRRSLGVIKIVFFGLEGAGAENKKAGCYAGIYGYSYERSYTPVSVLCLVFIVFGLSGLVLSYKGFKRSDGKGFILVVHGWISFVIALLSTAWLIAGDHVCVSNLSENVSAALGDGSGSSMMGT
jgi:hypothetical protein